MRRTGFATARHGIAQASSGNQKSTRGRNALQTPPSSVERRRDALGGNVSEAMSPLTAQGKREACRKMRDGVNILSRQRRRAGDMGLDGAALHWLAGGGETQAATEFGDGARGGGRLFLNFRFNLGLHQGGAGDRTVSDQRHRQQNRLQRSATPAVEGVENSAWQRGIHGVRAGRRPRFSPAESIGSR